MDQEITRNSSVDKEITSIIFLPDDDGELVWAFLPNGGKVPRHRFSHLLWASTNWPKSVCERLATNIISKEVIFPFYVNIYKKGLK